MSRADDRERVRVGLLGCGTIATAVHLRILRGMRGVEVTAVADPDPEARRRAAGLVGAETTADPESVVTRPDVDAIVVTTPSATHAALAVAAANAGKHLYVEKPVATTWEDAAAVADAVTRAGVVAAVGFNRRFHPVFEQARALVRGGAVGRVVAAQTTFAQQIEQLPDWKRARATGGGVLLDLGSHHADLLRWILDDEIAEVQANVGSGRAEGDSASVTWRFGRGVQAQSFFCFDVPRTDFVQLLGERGVVRADRYLPGVVHWRTDRGAVPRRRPLLPTRDVLAWRARRAIRQGEPSFRRALAHWIAAIRGDEVEIPRIADGVASLGAILAAEESAGRNGATVLVEHSHERP